jgi:ribosomal peptide maturation radical SAM protein 1
VKNIFELLNTCNIKDAKCMIIVPPFAQVDMPNLGVHILQGLARKQGVEVEIIYSNLFFASMIGLERYDILSHPPFNFLFGERVFSRSAHGLPAFGDDSQSIVSLASRLQTAMDTEDLCKIERCAGDFCEKMAKWLCGTDVRLIGFTSSYQQTNASIAIARRCKLINSHIKTVMGGANCGGSMGEAILSLARGAIDHVFSGESEQSFSENVSKLIYGENSSSRVIYGTPVFNLDDNPVPDYSNYFMQMKIALPQVDIAKCEIVYETSRGCWWGEKHQCTFCGLNPDAITFRSKSEDKVLNDLDTLLHKSPTKKIVMADNIMPYAYHKTLIPQLIKNDMGAEIIYEQKANLNLDQLYSLRSAGVRRIQPGIEALSSSLLKRMNKGTSARQNINCLRYARSIGIDLLWNLLVDFPNDQQEDYAETLRILPALVHLQPPLSCSPVLIDRFSEYYNKHSTYGIENIRPMPLCYAGTFPRNADLEALAYHFEADYKNWYRSSPETRLEVNDMINKWRAAWDEGAYVPALYVMDFDNECYMIVDTRNSAHPKITPITEEEVRVVLIDSPMLNPLSKWAIDNQYAVAIDGTSVALACASYETLKHYSAG